MGKLLATIKVPQFITKVKTANKIRAQYYRYKGGKWKPKKLPKTYRKKLNEGIYSKNSQGYLLDEDGERILKNKGTAGKPRYETLSGNKLLSGYGSPFTRAKLARGLKDFYRPFVQQHVRDKSPITTFPLKVTWDLYTTVEDAPNWDVFNLFFYYKYFEDSLHETTEEDDKHTYYYKGEDLIPMIPDDNVKFITWPAAPKIIPVENWEDRKFEFNFYHDDRPELRRKPWLSFPSGNS